MLLGGGLFCVQGSGTSSTQEQKRKLTKLTSMFMADLVTEAQLEAATAEARTRIAEIRTALAGLVVEFDPEEAVRSFGVVLGTVPDLDLGQQRKMVSEVFERIVLGTRGGRDAPLRASMLRYTPRGGAEYEGGSWGAEEAVRALRTVVPGFRGHGKAPQPEG